MYKTALFGIIHMNCRNENPKKKQNYRSKNQKIYLPLSREPSSETTLLPSSFQDITLNHQQKHGMERYH